MKKRGGRELEEVGEIEVAAVEHPDDDVLDTSLYPRMLSGNGIHKHKARRTLCRRREGRVQRGKHPQARTELQELVDHLQARQQLM